MSEAKVPEPLFPDAINQNSSQKVKVRNPYAVQFNTRLNLGFMLIAADNHHHRLANN